MNTKTVDSFYFPDKGMVDLNNADADTLRRVIGVQQETIADLNTFLAEGSPDDPNLIRLAKLQVAEVNALRLTFIAALQSGAITQEAYSGFKAGVELMNSIRMNTAKKMLTDVKQRAQYDMDKSVPNPALITVNSARVRLKMRLAKFFSDLFAAVASFLVIGIGFGVGYGLLKRWFG
jgi:hypothetical protein